ncbi:hypothetical protein [Ferruginibacter albus]|uniref:hypothetical protein n=1 Tax=Ferruginibacter albus TaxID=2875540 RepID=UPI001CC6B9FB|nr:hypothetical protein [Ferruginibacter albus]UAY53036.1 hypothetical protein K9M53_04990 [Ferruginibacter albus]
MPRTDLEKIKWLNNFSAKLGIYADKYHISGDDVVNMKAGAVWFSYWMDDRNKQMEYVAKLTQHKNEIINGVPDGATASVPPTPPIRTEMPPIVPPGVFKRASAIGRSIKNNISYTVADGNDLGLEGAEEVTDIHQMKPVLKLRLIAGGHPELIWKKEHMDGIEIYVDRGTGNWQLLAYDTHPNYTDTAALPASGTSAVWIYKAIYHYDDEQAGMWSDPASITVTGN